MESCECQESNFSKSSKARSAIVNQLYQEIPKDDRHTNVGLVSYEQINTPYFYDWSMRLVNLGELNETQKRYPERKYPHQNSCLALPDNLFKVVCLTG